MGQPQQSELRQLQDSLIQALLKQEDTISPVDQDIQADPASLLQSFPLTEIQQAYLLGRDISLDMGGVASHAYMEYQVPDICHQRLQVAWQKLIERHAMLRTVVYPEGYQQTLAQPPVFQVQWDDLREMDEESRQSRLLAIRQQMSHRVCPAGHWPSFAVHLCYLPKGQTRLHYSFDGLVMDVSSVPVIFREQSLFYEDPERQLPVLQISFRDYVMSLQNQVQSPSFQAARQYWLGKIPHMPPAPELPRKVAISPAAAPCFKRLQVDIEAGRWRKIKQQANRQGIAPTFVVLAAFVEVLQLWGRHNGISLNLTLFNRPAVHPQINALIGDFTDLLVLAVDYQADWDFCTRARGIQDGFWQDMAHREFDGVKVMREIGRYHSDPGRARMPVVFTSNLFIGDLNDSLTLAGKPLDLGYVVSQTPQVSLDHQVYERHGQLQLVWDVLEGVYVDGVLERMLQSYANLLEQLADTPSLWHTTQPLCLPGAMADKQWRYNQTREAFPHQTLPGLFIHQCDATPSHTAILHPQGQVSYMQLRELANGLGQVVHHLNPLDASLVAVVMPKSWLQVVAVMGIHFANRAYLPLDPMQPSERIQQILTDAGVQTLVTLSEVVTALTLPEQIQQIVLNEHGQVTSVPALELATSPCALPTPTSLAYVIYTSGSTGKPKGVMIDHQGAVNTILDINQRFSITSNDKVLALSNLNFDLSVYDIFGTLAGGATIVMPTEMQRKEPEHWLAVMKRHQVTVWNSVPALLQMLVEYSRGQGQSIPASLRLAMLSGDWIPLDLPRAAWSLAPELKIHSLGGATEASIWSITHPIDHLNRNIQSVPYGRPLSNQQCYVLDQNMRPRPDWVTGHLFIAGDGLALGYWQDPDKTSAAFVLNKSNGQRLYRTGDLARFLPDGNIEFMGREDAQIKIRGHRIELGEIEAALKQQKGLSDALVTVQQLPHQQHNAQQHMQLVAYLVLAPQPDAPVVKQMLADEDMCMGIWQRLDSCLSKTFTGLLAEAEQIGLMESWRIMDVASLGMLARLVAELGVFHRVGERASVAQIVQERGIKSEYQPVLAQWLKLLVRAGWLQLGQGDIFRCIRPLQMREIDRWWQAQNKVPASLIAWEADFNTSLTQLCAHHVAYLKGSRDPLQAFMQSDGEATVQSLTRANLAAPYYQQALTQVLQNMSQGQRLKVLEIGGRAGVLTSKAINALPAGSEYVYCDESAYLLQQMKQRFDASEQLQFEIFDLNNAPQIQGLKLYQYDIVIADNSLHRAKDLRLSLGFVLSLLKPGGILCVLETTSDSPLMPLTAGLFEQGFSHLQDHRAERGSPLLSAQAWRQLLEETGFCQVNSYPQQSDLHRQHWLLAQAPLSQWCFDETALRAALSKILPDYMLPQHYMLIDSVPLSANGKLNRAALPPLRLSATACETEAHTPQNIYQQQVQTLFKRVLQLDQLGNHDNFFALGGDSLRAIQCLNLFKDELGITLTLQDFFTAGTVAQLALQIENKNIRSGTVADLEEGEI